MTLQQAVIKKALTFLGTHDGLPFLRMLGIHFKTAWCAAFVGAVWLMVSPHNDLPRSASCYQLWAQANRDPFRYRVVTSEEMEWSKASIPEASIAIFSHSPTHSEWLGHAALIIQYEGHGRFESIEGNTSPNAKGDQRMGNTVATKQRRAGLHSFWLEGAYWSVR